MSGRGFGFELEMGPPPLAKVDTKRHVDVLAFLRQTASLSEDVGCSPGRGCATGPHSLASSGLASTFQKGKVRLQAFRIPNQSLEMLLMAKLGRLFYLLPERFCHFLHLILSLSPY